MDKFKELLRDISVKNLIYIAGAVGILLIFLAGSFTEEKNLPPTEESIDYCSVLEDRLEEILPEISSVGKVSVMITAKNYGKIILAKNNADGGEETLVLSQKGGGEDAKVIEEIYPAIQGVIIAAEGGAKSKVKEDITEAVMALLGVEAHKIKVFERIGK